MDKPAVIAVSSLVARGGVGLRATAFALERIGFPVWQVPTIFLPWHTGHGPSTRIVPPAEGFAGVLQDLAGSPYLAQVGAVLSGYLGSPAQAEAIAALVGAVKRVRPDALFVCDPVIGDEEGLYVPEATAAAIRDLLLPIADVTTPNRYELAWLAGRPTGTPAEALAAARALPPKTVLVTSAPALMRGQIGVMLASPEGALVAEHPWIEGAPSGVGDLAGAILTAGLLEGRPAQATLAWIAASLYEMVRRSKTIGDDELAMVPAQDVFVRPMANITVRRMAEAAPGR
jgi:pyridoxine kinase